MGHIHTKTVSDSPNRPESNRLETWLYHRKQNILTSFGYPHAASTNADIPPDNIFVPIQQDDILSQIPIGRHHPVPRKGVEDDDTRTMHTNKFYANAFLGDQNEPIWTHPYSLWWGKGVTNPGLLKSVGLCVSHVEESDLEYGTGDPPNFYLNPYRKQCLILSAAELDQSTVLTTDTHSPFSVNISLSISSAPHEPKITFPVVQGMSFVTAGYRDAVPTIQTDGKGFVDFAGPLSVGNAVKYHIKDMDGRDWLIYVNVAQGTNYDATKFLKLDPNTIVGPPSFKGTIQVAKNPLGAEGEALYDRACGAFVTSAQLTAVVNDNKGPYAFSYSKIGAAPLLMFALPHHMQSLDPDLRNQVTKLRLRTSTKGTATAIWTEKLTLIESNLPTTMSFGPWSASQPTSKPRYPPEVLLLIGAVAKRDLRRCMTDPIPPESFYYAGKSFAKFATIVWIIKDVLSNDALATTGLTKLKSELAKYIANSQLHPLYYDDTWKGIVSSTGFTDTSADFGNTLYNDHHFHWSYFVYTAAVIAYLEPEWLKENNGQNRTWTNMLVKDYAESDYNGRDFPWQRSMDWWHGHSWAKGLVESADGKDQESSSEDGWSAFVVKMWGKVIGDQSMEKRGTLQLAVQARAFNNYFYFDAANTIHPARFIPNKVAGILFENKVDYATYFGSAPELIHGIHMVPISPPTTLLRPRQFVKEEWEAFFDKGRANVDGGWRGILYANLASLDPRASYAFFRDGINGFWDERWIDGGASRTWYLVWAAGMSDLMGRR
ncbi:endo-1,3(4)-beta-glucanase 1 precursor [Phaeosphaeriaceae sp. SRC1lsM3a]|nr:endo-1,3(4)-beta-glucanase 1 precursor [Stagonospora sp. SRC1lsM3a]